jgi:hypothetical protein
MTKELAEEHPRKRRRLCRACRLHPALAPSRLCKGCHEKWNGPPEALEQTASSRP